ncbi:MAG: NADPH-dependent FMN reductase [Candidatus Saccharimonadaceae bacterium]
MSSILVVTGSVRPNSVNQKIVPLVVAEVEAQGASVVLADLKAINLPFFDGPASPLAPGFEPTNDAARDWTKLVAEADGVVFVTPEYNHTLTPVQLNAIDWIGKEWADKPVALVGYGWSGASQAHATAREALSVNLKATIGDDQANLFFMKDLGLDGTIIDQEAVQKKIATAVSELLASVPVGAII